MLVFHIFGALAEFERNLIRERTKAGLAALNNSTSGRMTLETPISRFTVRRVHIREVSGFESLRAHLIDALVWNQGVFVLRTCLNREINKPIANRSTTTRARD